MTGILLLDNGDLNEIFLREEIEDYDVFCLTVTALNDEGRQKTRSFCVLGCGTGDALTMAYSRMRQDGFCRDFAVTKIWEGTLTEDDRRSFDLKEISLPGQAPLDLLRRLDPDNAIFVSALIADIYSFSEEELFLEETEKIPYGRRYIRDSEPVPEEELIRRDWETVSHDMMRFETQTDKGQALHSRLEWEFQRAKNKQEQKRILSIFILLGYGTSFPWTAYRMVMDGQMPRLWE